MSGLPSCLWESAMLLWVVVVCLLLLLCRIPLCEDTLIYLSLLLLIDIWVVWSLGLYEECCCRHSCMYLLGICCTHLHKHVPRREFLGLRLCLCSSFVGAGKQFSKVVVLIPPTHTSYIWECSCSTSFPTPCVVNLFHFSSSMSV